MFWGQSNRSTSPAKMKLVLVIIVMGSSIAASSSKIDTFLVSSLAFRRSANVLVSFKEKTSTALASLSNNTYSDREEHLTTVTSTLQSFSQASQRSALKVLTLLGFTTFQVLWIVNKIYLERADQKVVAALAAVENVAGIREEILVGIDPVIDGESTPAWGIENIQAPAAWKLPGGNQGKGIIVGSIDSGVHGTHQDLRDNFVGEYGWRDFTGFSFVPSVGDQKPTDDNGHGTHTVGTMVGKGGIGVAPEAKWMACKALNALGNGKESDLINCGQFMLCPTLPDGSSKNCSKAPHVINNSWGGGQNDFFYNEVIAAWHAANIIPVFANGNSGPKCGTDMSPADSIAGVIAVGATNLTNTIATFSSKGPTVGDPTLLKPDISAPGVLIKSAWNKVGDKGYKIMSGTSMAAPHVAGVIALLLSRKNDLKFIQVWSLLTETTQMNMTPSGVDCGEISESTYPNFAAGYGIVNAFNALEAAIKTYGGR